MDIFSEDEARDCHYAGLQAKAENWERMMRKGPDGFRPCPICGRRLTAKEIVLADDEGDLMMDLMDAMDDSGAFDMRALESIGLDASVLTWGVNSVCIQCGCGFSYWTSNGFDLTHPSWLQEFAERVNRRMGE